MIDRINLHLLFPLICAIKQVVTLCNKVANKLFSFKDGILFKLLPKIVSRKLNNEENEANVIYVLSFGIVGSVVIFLCVYINSLIIVY